MKKLPPETVALVEVENEGLVSLLGQVVTLMCMNYIYTGRLAGVNTTCVLLEEASVVFETGAYSCPTWKLAEKLPNSLYVNTSAIEAFAIIK